MPNQLCNAVSQAVKAAVLSSKMAPYSILGTLRQGWTPPADGNQVCTVNAAGEGDLRQDQKIDLRSLVCSMATVA
ncbi:hypothetical protein STH12_04286 (plasmid) [Shewanella khirikhana]|uniref:Uncharacterized protein n=1 Tax=Shewanella khirikhana TaxID=1965282 RepID=A0ABM9SBF8_9GAMM|nr:hypothetical protein STH12_04286 [Shewanella khirikhana]